MPQFPLKLPAIKIKQPLGDFFVVSLDAATIREVTFLDPTRIDKVDPKSFFYTLLGAQRPSSTRRAKQIAKYIDTVEAAFPNSIILAANYINDGELQEDEEKRWEIRKAASGTSYELLIPTSEKMASVIDGQHRLLGFDYCLPHRKTMDLLCAVYMDLPHAYQAYLFATININQRRVDKSLAYEQFGYNLDEETKSGWAPDKLAVYFSRKLNLDAESPFHGRIKVAPLNAELLLSPSMGIADWQVSTACVVDGIAKLISQNPKNDRDILHQKSLNSRVRSSLPKDDAPLRFLYLGEEDTKIYEIIVTFFLIVKKRLWDVADNRSLILKTAGIRALFDVLRASVGQAIVKKPESQFDKIVSASSKINFSEAFFEGSGKGRVRLKNTMLFLAEMISKEDLPSSDRNEYLAICQKYSG